MAITVENLSKFRYFKGAEPGRLAGLPQLFTERTYQKGQAIVSEGDASQNLYFVGAGVVKIFKMSPEGKEQIIKLARPGDSFNDPAVFSSGPGPYTAQAMGATTIYVIGKSDLLPFMEKNWLVAGNALEELAEQERLLLTLVEDLSFKNVTGRVAKILLQNAAAGPEGVHRLTQYEMAAMARTAREVVGRSLKALEDSGAIKLDRHRIVIVNKEYLDRLAGLS